MWISTCAASWDLSGPDEPGTVSWGSMESLNPGGSQPGLILPPAESGQCLRTPVTATTMGYCRHGVGGGGTLFSTLQCPGWPHPCKKSGPAHTGLRGSPGSRALSRESLPFAADSIPSRLLGKQQPGPVGLQEKVLPREPVRPQLSPRKTRHPNSWAKAHFRARRLHKNSCRGARWVALSGSMAPAPIPLPAPGTHAACVRL